MNKLTELQRERVIGYNLDQYLRMHEVSKTDLAERLSCDVLKVNEILTNSVSINEEFLQAIIEELGITRSELETVPDIDELSCHNLHCMGKITDAQSMIGLSDKVDFYVRLLNADKNR